MYTKVNHFLLIVFSETTEMKSPSLFSHLSVEKSSYRQPSAFLNVFFLFHITFSRDHQIGVGVLESEPESELADSVVCEYGFVSESNI